MFNIHDIVVINSYPELADLVGTMGYIHHLTTMADGSQELLIVTRYGNKYFVTNEEVRLATDEEIKFEFISVANVNGFK